MVARGVVDSLSTYFESIKCSLGADTEAVAACEFACQSLIFVGFLLRVVRVALAQPASSSRASTGAIHKTLALISASSKDLTARTRAHPKSPVPAHNSLLNLTVTPSLPAAAITSTANCINSSNSNAQLQPQPQPLGELINSELCEQQQLNEVSAPKSENGPVAALAEESAPTARSSKSRRRQRQRERQQSKNSQCESVGGGSNAVGDTSGGATLNGSRELSLADSTRGVHLSGTRTRTGTVSGAVALEDDASQLLAALAASDLLGVLNALYSMLLSSGSSWRRLLGSAAAASDALDTSAAHRDTTYLLLEASSALPAECLQPIGSIRVALSAFRFMNELAATNLLILQARDSTPLHLSSRSLYTIRM